MVGGWLSRKKFKGKEGVVKAISKLKIGKVRWDYQ